MSHQEIGPRERAYEAKIAKLINEIVDICHKNNIPFLATFELDIDNPNEPDNPLNCTTLQCHEYATGAFFKRVEKAVRDGIGR